MRTWIPRFLVPAICMLGCVAAPAAEGAPFPSRPIKFVVPYSPGGLADMVARLVASTAAPKLGQPVIVDNRAGANGTIGTAAVANAEPDGHTLAFVASSHVFGRALMPSLGYDPLKSFAPITLATRTPVVFVASAKLPVASMADFIAYARQHPKELSFASAGSGSNVHVFGQWLNSAANLQMTHVPYKGSAAAHMDLVSGIVNAAFDTLPSVQPQVTTGGLRLLAVGSSQRLPQYPGVPTVAESGIKGFEAGSWVAVLAPARTPQPVVQVLNRAIAEALRTPAVQKKLKDAGAEVVAGTPEDLAALMASEERRYGELIRRLAITAD